MKPISVSAKKLEKRTAPIGHPHQSGCFWGRKPWKCPLCFYIIIRKNESKKQVKTLQKTGKKVQRRKKSKKLVKKACKVGGDVVLYLSAKRWDKRMTSKSQLEVKRKEPIDARKSGRNARDFRDAPSSVRNEKLRKNKAWQKTASVVK